MKNALSLVLLLLVISLPEITVSADSPKLRAGAAVVDITPTIFPVNMPGGFNENPATSAHDQLSSRALVLDDGSTTIAMVVVDSLGVDPDVIEEAKVSAAAKTGIPIENMLVCSTHSHSCPPSNATQGRPGDVAYRAQILGGIGESIVLAHKALEPASFGSGKHALPEEVFNRRWYLKPGKMPLNPFGGLDQVKMNPGRSNDILDRPAGPTDPDVQVISIVDERKRPMALFANYALHYVGGIPSGQVSSDYFGEFARLMPSRMRGRGDLVAMMSNGASGDINNIPFGVTRPPREPFEQARIVARKAADAAWFAYKQIDSHRDDVSLGMREREVTLAYRKPSADQLEAAKKVLSITSERERAALPRLAEAYARRSVAAADRPDHVTVKVQAIRIGELAVCGFPFETLVEIGLDLRQVSPFPQTIVVGIANGRYGYLPPPRQHRLGGYETWLGTNQVQIDASDILSEHLREMLSELHMETK